MRFIVEMIIVVVISMAIYDVGKSYVVLPLYEQWSNPTNNYYESREYKQELEKKKKVFGTN